MSCWWYVMVKVLVIAGVCFFLFIAFVLTAIVMGWQDVRRGRRRIENRWD